MHDLPTQLQRFLQQVFNFSVNLDDLLQDVNSHTTSETYLRMISANSIPISTQMMFERIRKKFSVKGFSYGKLSDKPPKIEPVKTFAFKDSEKPEQMGESYRSVSASGVELLGVRNYLLATTYRKWIHGEWMDSFQTATILSSWEEDGSDILGLYRPELGLCLYGGLRSKENPKHGVRERFT
jgi:hypothetical protein